MKTNIKISIVGVILTIIFVILKAKDFVSWPWIWVFSPLWVSSLIPVIIVLFLMVQANREMKIDDGKYAVETISEGGERAVNQITVMSNRFVDDVFANSAYVEKNLNEMLRSEPAKWLIHIAYICSLRNTAKDSIPSKHVVSQPSVPAVAQVVQDIAAKYGGNIGRLLRELRESGSPVDQAFYDAAKPYLDRLEKLHMPETMKKSVFTDVFMTLRDVSNAN